MIVRIPILTGRQQAIVRDSGGYKAFVRRAVEKRWGVAAPATWVAAGEPVKAHIVRSSWRANCPDCPEIMVVEPGEPFFCPNCLNAKNEGKPRPVAWPKERAEIERLLLKRPDPQTRNWLAGEPLANLIAENIAHGHEG